MASGGTGGHLFPASAVAQTLVNNGWKVRLVTDSRGSMHAQAFPRNNIMVIDSASPFVKNPIQQFKAILHLLNGCRQALRIIKSDKPDIIVGFGGYPVFPVFVAAKLRSIPYIIHEQNAVLGRVNRLFAKGARAIASGFSQIKYLGSHVQHHVTGNPIRHCILKHKSVAYSQPADEEVITILVLGGSLGAEILSKNIPPALGTLPNKFRKRLCVIQQTRVEFIDDVRSFYQKANIACELAPFFDDVGKCYARAHLVISRAGASSVSEIAALGRPAILVPLAIAMDDHQSANTVELVDRGAAVCITESELTKGTLSNEIQKIL